MRRRRQRWGLGAVTALSLVVNTWGLGRNGLGNLYYTAGVRSMTESGHNFFFNTFDPGGFITVDKPPVAQWIATLSVHLLGFDSWGLLLPSALAGAATVAVLWCIVARHLGWAAATVAGVVLALSPINVAVDRVNLPDPFLILFLTVAAWAVLRSLEGPRALLWAAAAGGCIGLAFNTKLLVAAIPVPAMGLVMLCAGDGDWVRRLRNASVFGAAAAASSAWWLLILDATNPRHRPYIGGSTNNTVWNQAFGYNGLNRLQGAAPAPRPVAAARNPLQGFSVLFGGHPGPLRLFNAALGPQVAWLLPLAVAGTMVGIAQAWGWGHRLEQAVIGLFGGWLATFAIVFSEASGTFHSYYVSALTPGLAVLVGVGGVGLASLARRRPAWLAAGLVAMVATVGVQRLVADRSPSFFGWTVTVLVVVTVAGAVVVASSYGVAEPRRSQLLAGGLVVLFVGAMVAPAGWALSDASHPTLNPTMPAAGPRESLAAITFGARGSGGDPVLAAWLRSHQRRARWELAVTNGPGAAGLIADESLSVLALGGFEGSDPAIDVRSFAALVSRGEVRYVEPVTRFGGITGFAGVDPPARVMRAVMVACPAVVTTRRNHLPAAYSRRLYDCRGRARELAAQA